MQKPFIVGLFSLIALALVHVTSAGVPEPPPGVPLDEITVGPDQYATEPADAIGWMAPGFKMTVLAGTYYKPFTIPVNLDGFLIEGACGDDEGQTIFDGQGGAPEHTLAAGKGFVHTNSPGTIRNIVFQNCGGADGAADGEAGLYAENFENPGTVYADHCAFKDNENGIFVPATNGGPGDGVAMYVTNSDFENNGQSKDGQAHDLYVQGDSYTEVDCNHYGNPYGNNIKVRSPLLSVTGGYHENKDGSRWIDFPNGGTATVSGGTFVILSTSPGANIVGYGEEGADNGLGGFTFTDGAHLYIGRPNSALNVASGGVVTFDDSVKVTWTDADATLVVNGGGSQEGLETSPGSSIGENPEVPPYASISSCDAGDTPTPSPGSDGDGDGDSSAAEALRPYDLY